MRRNIPTAWAGLILAQMNFMRQSTDLLAGNLGRQRPHNPQPRADGSLNATEGRLNPIEFHGKRQTPDLRG